MKNQFPRMLGWALLTVVLIFAAMYSQVTYPGTLLAVTLYKAHLMALGGWGGYWLDRALFPYARPDFYAGLGPEYGGAPLKTLRGKSFPQSDLDQLRKQVASEYRELFASATLRRAIVVAACLICVGLGA